MESIANVTDVHEAMYFHVDDELAARNNFGIWSLRWSPDGREVIAGTGDKSLYVYDVETQKVCTHQHALVSSRSIVALGQYVPSVGLVALEAFIVVWSAVYCAMYSS